MSHLTPKGKKCVFMDDHKRDNPPCMSHFRLLLWLLTVVCTYSFIWFVLSKVLEFIVTHYQPN